MACRVSIPREKLKYYGVPSHGGIPPARGREEDTSAWEISGEGASALILLLHRVSNNEQ